MNNLILYKNARLLDPASGLDKMGQLLTCKGKIVELGDHITPRAEPEIIDCAGKCLCPGLIDMAVFVGSSGVVNTGKSAAAGGVTTVCIQPDTHPIIDDLAQVAFLEKQAHGALVNFIAFPAITKNLDGQEMTEIGLMSQAGIPAFTDGNKSVPNAALMSRVFEYSAMFDAVIIQHLAVPELTGTSGMNAGALAIRLGLPGIPTVGETIMLERDIRLLKSAPTRYHAAQVTCMDSIMVIAAAKKEKLTLTAGVAVPHFSLNEYAIEDYNTATKLSPPLRSEDDRVAVLEGLKNGTIDVIVSGHCPVDQENKRVPYELAVTGAIGLETMLPVSLEIYHNGTLPLLDILAKMTCNPAKILGLDGGVLTVGAPADLCIFDPDVPYRIDQQKMTSSTLNTPFEGRPVQGRVLRTVVQGKTIFEYTK